MLWLNTLFRGGSARRLRTVLSFLQFSTQVDAVALRTSREYLGAVRSSILGHYGLIDLVIGSVRRGASDSYGPNTYFYY